MLSVNTPPSSAISKPTMSSHEVPDVVLSPISLDFVSFHNSGENLIAGLVKCKAERRESVGSSV